MSVMSFQHLFSHKECLVLLFTSGSFCLQCGHTHVWSLCYLDSSLIFAFLLRKQICCVPLTCQACCSKQTPSVLSLPIMYRFGKWTLSLCPSSLFTLAQYLSPDWLRLLPVALNFFPVWNWGMMTFDIWASVQIYCQCWPNSLTQRWLLQLQITVTGLWGWWTSNYKVFCSLLT